MVTRKVPTILDVASEAGVSKSTVSNVVRGLPGVSEATRLRVQSAIEELGYRPNVLARQLVQQRTSILGVVVGDLANPFFGEMAKLVERHAATRGYHPCAAVHGYDLYYLNVMAGPKRTWKFHNAAEHEWMLK